MSILSFPDRGPWGDPTWRGNCSGHIYRDLMLRLKPTLFVDPMMGSGTSIEVAKELGIMAIGLDLHAGFNILRDPILERLPRPAGLVLSHPPYGDMILYSGVQWGDRAHPDDLSRCTSVEDFHDKLQLALINQRDSTAPGGYYGTIIGDQRKGGTYVSFQAEAIARMPADELAAVIIKEQHNVQSGSKQYRGMKLPLIEHEYILLWQRKDVTLFSFLKKVATQAQSRLTGTWINVVKQCLLSLGGQADLTQLYDTVERMCNSDKLNTNHHWRDKVRQVLNSNPNHFTSVERGVWAMA